MEVSFRKRLSSVLAWLGFVTPFWLGMFWRGSYYYHEGDFILGLYVYGLCAVINYLIVGRFRLLPWIKE